METELQNRLAEQAAENADAERGYTTMQRHLCTCGDQRAAHSPIHGCAACEACKRFSWTGDTLDEWAVALRAAGYKTEEEQSA